MPCALCAGVLKEKHGSLFDFPLPAEKLSCIENLGFGTVDKIFVHYPEETLLNAGKTLPVGYSFLSKETVSLRFLQARSRWLNPQTNKLTLLQNELISLLLIG